MNCVKCGSLLSQEVNFCGHCGEKVDNERVLPAGACPLILINSNDGCTLYCKSPQKGNYDRSAGGGSLFKSAEKIDELVYCNHNFYNCPYFAEESPETIRPKSIAENHPPAAQDQTHDWSRFWKVFASTFVIGAFLLYLLVNGLSGSSGGAFGSDKPDEAGAFVFSQSYAENSLKSPSTAKFASISDSFVLKTSEDTFDISSYVDAQNSFGATVRTHYRCKVRYVNGSWAVEDFEWKDY